MGRLAITLHLILYYAEISLVIYSLATLESTTWRLIFGLLLVSTMICNISSYVRVAQTMDFYHKPCGLFLCAILHLLQLGPLWRYIKLMTLYEKVDSEDFMHIKLLHNCLFSVPVTLGIVEVYLSETSHLAYAITAGVCFISTLLTFVVFGNFQIKKQSDIAIWVCTLCWRTFMLFSRLSALVWALSSPHGVWSALILGVHFIVLMIWYQLREQSEENSCSIFRMWLLLLSLADTVDLTIFRHKVNIEWLVGYYSSVLCENTTMVIIWYASLSHPYQLMDTLWLVAVFASFALGLLLSLTTLALSAREDKHTTLQKTLKFCCPGSRRDDLDKAPFVWDSYDTKRKPTCHTNKVFEIEERQKHVDIINNPLGVATVVSLSTSTTPNPRSPETVKERPVAHETIAQKQVTGKGEYEPTRNYDITTE